MPTDQTVPSPQAPLHQTVMITGAGKGLGRATALAFARAGARLSLASRTAPDLEMIRREAGAEPLCRAGDVADERFIERWVGETLERFGAVDVLINNAGVLTPRGPLTLIATADWDETMRVNLRGPFLSMKRVLPGMVARRSGCVINVTSGAGKRARARGGPYAVSKFGVEGLTRIAAAEVAEHGVRVNALNPGGTRTRMRAAAYPDEDPLTLPSPDDVAEFFLWMAGPECRANGASLDYREWIKNGKRLA